MVALVLASALLACGPAEPPDVGSAAEDRPLRGGTLVVALRADIDSWNPYTTHDATAANILDLLYPRLLLETSSDHEGSSFDPWLAGSWEFSPDRLRLTFHLVEGAQWSNGTPVTCEDVRFTYRAQMAEELAWPGTFIKNRIAGIDCPEDRTAVFRFTEAYPDQLLDANDNAIVPAVYGEIPFDEWAATSWEDRSVTCGPYRLSAVRPGQEAVLERDPGWWRVPGSYVDRVILRVYPEASGVVPRFLEGEVDLLAKLPALRAQEVEARPDLRLVELPSLSYTYLGWNMLEPGAYLEDRRDRNCGNQSICREEVADIRRLQREHPHPILADPEVRKALALAIDREDLVLGLWAGHARIGTSPIVSALWAHDPSTALPFDHDLAAAWLEQAGWSDRDGDGIRDRDGRPLKLTVIVNSENRVRRDALERVVANLRQIGVDLVPEPLPRAEFVARARDKNFDVVLSGWWAGTRIQPQNHLHTKAALHRGNNLVSWSTSASDELLDRAAAAADRAEALPLWREWQQEFREAQPITILYEERGLIGLNGRVRGPAPLFLNPYQNLHAWWFSSDDPGGG